MSKMIQLRHVPDALHRRLRARAALEGLSLSDYLLREIRRIAELPAPAKMRARLAGASRSIPQVSAALVRHPHDLPLPRIWALRENATAYDAAYRALAAALEAPLLTCDVALASAGWHRAEVELSR
jgi:antitoxin FitA